MQEIFTGQLLVASTLVTEPIYSGGVCLVVHEDGEDVIGVMLNRPIQPNEEALLSISEASMGDGEEPKPRRVVNRLGSIEKVVSSPHPPEALKMLHFGGPVSGPIVAVHQNKHLAEAETGQGVYVAAQRHHLEGLVRQPSHPYRLIVGHIRWTRSQLDLELASGIWHCLPATRQAVFGASEQMWRGMIRRATTRSMSNWIGTPDVPNAYELN